MFNKEKRTIAPEYDLRYLQAALIDLEGYLLSDELYWPIGASVRAGEPAFPRLTLGSVLLSLKRLEARPLTQQQQAELERLKNKMDVTFNRWRAAWGRKAAAGFKARLNLWRDFLDEYRQQPGENVDRYSYEVRRRLMLDLLLPTADDVPQSELDLLSGLDSALRSALTPGPFIWEADIEKGFPPESYWYLYGNLKP